MIAVTELAAADAQLLWLSARTPNDQFLVYAFDGAVGRPGIDAARRRAERCAELRLRVSDEHRWRYPRWVPAEVRDEQFVVHDEPAGAGDFGALARLAPLDPTRMTWRMHLFGGGIAVVQMSHALGDGTRSSALAAALLGRPGPVPAVGTARRGSLVRLGLRAARAQRHAPAPIPPRPALSVNRSPGGAPVLRTLVFDRDRLVGPTVTVAALSAIGEALGGYLAGRGEDVLGLAAEVPVAGPPDQPSRNNFRNVGIGLHPAVAGPERLRRIAAELGAARRRGEGTAVRAEAAAFAATPAWLLRWGISRFDPTARPAAVTGHTVVSSVNRGAADLELGGRSVRYTAGFPARSAVHGLTHGVHGIGGTVAISVHADSAVIDIEDYLERLAHALA